MSAGADRWLDGESEPRTVRHGPWTVTLTDDSVDDIRWGTTLVLRAVRWVIRDHQWRTVPIRVTHRAVSATDDRMVLAVEGGTVDPDVAMTITGELVLHADALRYAITGRAGGDFRRNRVGLVVLHPPEWAGTPVSVRHPDGRKSEIVVPHAIAPHQPAMDVAGFSWPVEDVQVDLDLAGDVFETEDQRNWTDASFKTYGTPLALPIPVTVTVGEQVDQAVELRCRTTADRAAAPIPSQQQPISPASRFPEIALAASTAPGTHSATVRPPVVLIELDLDAAHWPAALERAAGEADRLDVRLVCADTAPIDGAVRALAAHRVVRLGVFDRHSHVSEPVLWAELAAAADAAGLRAELVGGTRAHFTELSRTLHRLETSAAAISVSVTPQMHERARRQVVESIGVQGLVAAQAVGLARGARVHIGPVTLRPRFNAVATDPPAPGREPGLEHGYGAQLVRDATDPRQASVGGAAWYLAAAMALAVEGVESLTLCETWGPRGLEPADGDPYPVAQAVRWLLELAGAPVRRPATPAGVTVLVADHQGESVVLAANPGATDEDVEVDMGAAMSGSVETLSGPGGPGPDIVPADVPDGRLHLAVPAAGAVRWTGRTQAAEQ